MGLQLVETFSLTTCLHGKLMLQQCKGVSSEMDFLSAWIESPLVLPFLCLIWGTQAQQAFRTEPKNHTVKAGATAVLRCEVLRASGTVQWTKDGFLLGPERSLPGFPRYSMIGNPKRGQYHLQIEKAQLEDDALYQCQAGKTESGEGIASNTAWLQVLIPPSSPYFEEDMTTPWIAGKQYSVTCVAPEAKPAAKITLYKDGVKLTGAESFNTTGSKDKLLNTHAKVTITALGSDNGKQLVCHAKNEALQPVETLLTMNVYFPPQPPVIVGLEREEVRAGRLLVLECASYGGNPLATIHWTKNGEVLSQTWKEDVQQQGSVNVLKLKITPADNQAVLCCESGNLVSPSPLSVSRKITVLFEPAEVILSGSFTAVEGEVLDLSCFASSSNPPVQIRWWLGHKELNTTAVVMEEGDNGGMTTMSNTTHQVSREEDGLQLTCEAFNKGTHFSKIQMTKLTVYYPPQKVWIEAPPTDVPLYAGTKVRLTCFSTGGNPTGTLTWFKNGKGVSDAVKKSSFDRGVAQELVLVLTASDNMATYRCDAQNEANKIISAQTKLKVYFVPVGMKITANQQELRRGQTLTLDCMVGSSNPKANVSWSVGPLRFQGEEQPPTRSVYGGVSVLSSLSLNLSSQHHNQKVICQAYSSILAEGTNTFFKLNVLYPPEFSPQQPTQVQVVEDDMATIPLLVSANPEEVSCVWLHRKEKLVIEGNPRYRWSDEYSLEIENVTRKDAGVYTVECTNDEGVNHISITLDVQYAPSVKAEKDPVFVNVGDTADLICVADANPIISDMFMWKWLGEREVEMGEETQQDESGLLTIHDVTRAHAGLYQCTANNGIAPPASVDVQLVVQFKPEVQKGAQWRKVASRGDGTTTAEIMCEAEGIPPVDFSWEKNGVLMDFANPRYEEQTMRRGSLSHRSTVRVINVSAAHDYAVFSCTARNSLGEDKLDIQLVSTSHPDPPSSFQSVSVTHDSVTLEWIPGFSGGLLQRFRIRYRWDQAVSYYYMDVFPPTATIFTVSGLQPLTTYNFSVNALNAMGESDYADNNAVLTITTKEREVTDETPTDEDLGPHSTRRLPAYLTLVFTLVFGVLLVLNSLGCFLGWRWKKRRAQTGGKGSSVLDGNKSKEEGSSRSTVSNSNKYQSREKINATAQRTLLIESGSETDSNVYESYAAESSHYYYPTADHMPSLSPHPEETRRPDAIHLPVDSHGHLYEDVGGGGLYQDILPTSLPSPPSLFDHRSPPNNNWTLIPSYYQQDAGRAKEFTDVQQLPRDSDLPFELRGELV